MLQTPVSVATKKTGQRGSPTQSEMVVPKTVPHFLGEDVALLYYLMYLGYQWVPFGYHYSGQAPYKGILFGIISQKSLISEVQM